MKVVVAPDKFAGTLSAAEAAAAIALGWLSIRPEDELVLVPMADGGEGTIEVVREALPHARTHTSEVSDARGRMVAATWLGLPDGRALVEAAQACGLSRLGSAERDPLTATSFGVGELLLAASRAGHEEIVVGLGGTATVDGGARLAEALQEEPLRARIVVAVDVDTQLLGPHGAVAGFARQKGAAEADLPILERRLEQLADSAEAAGGSWRELPGAGAAGGLGFGLAAFCGGRLEPGAPLIGALVGLEDSLAGAGLVITGEGALDRQTQTGKVPAYVAGLARARGLTVLALAGRIEDGAGALFNGVAELGPGGLERPAELLSARAADLAHLQS
ncbi:MAG TPA: glycerate kinase [Gaiellaceae bacterium]|nr:glycerate kinase [Gaiellaceae bacterium]